MTAIHLGVKEEHLLDLQLAIEAAEVRFREEIKRATKGKGVDAARIKRRTNEQYCERLARACFNLSHNIELSDSFYSLVAAIPEILLGKMHFLGWGDARKQEGPGTPAPKMFSEYAASFPSTFRKSETEKLIEDLREGKIQSGLIAHGLSPTSDTILLLADLGRCLRVASALKIFNVQVLLADVSWIKYNRSVTQILKRVDFINALRICLDKRKRLYSALSLEYKVFRISDFHDGDNAIGHSVLKSAAERFRDLAAVLWGDVCLQPHDAAVKKLIGSPFGRMDKKTRESLPGYLLTLTSFEEFSNAIEHSLRNELSVLRTISDLFSTFDRDVFIYYFAQYYAQRKYNNFVKLASISETKFDEPFVKNAEQFDAFAPLSGGAVDISLSHQVYFHQYRLGRYEILPYTSTSGDVVKNNVPLDTFLNGSILLEDSYNNKIDKILGVLADTPTVHRNRLVSDLLSFTHFLIARLDLDDSVVERLRKELSEIDDLVAEQVFSKEDEPVNYPGIFAEWVRAIASKDAVLPLHLRPYLWGEEDWSVDMRRKCAQMIQELLRLVNEICE